MSCVGADLRSVEDADLLTQLRDLDDGVLFLPTQLRDLDSKVFELYDAVVP
jgi:hypothetical protein